MIRTYQASCAAVIQRFDGHIAQYLGDGLLVYFGSPQAHEDDASRAVHAGLAIVAAFGSLNTRLEHDRGIRLAVRVGIHTGLMVWEDLHWADPSTLEWLGLCMDQAPTARLLTLLTCRPEFRSPWAMRSHLTQLTLSRFTRPQGEAMVTWVAGEGAAGRGDATDCGQDRWRAPVCGRVDQDGAGVGSAPGAR